MKARGHGVKAIWDAGEELDERASIEVGDAVHAVDFAQGRKWLAVATAAAGTFPHP